MVHDCEGLFDREIRDEVQQAVVIEEDQRIRSVPESLDARPRDQQLAIRLDRIEMNRVRVYDDRSGAVDSHAMQTMNGVPTRAAASDHDDLRAGGAKRVEERLVPGALRGLEAHP